MSGSQNGEKEGVAMDLRDTQAGRECCGRGQRGPEETQMNAHAAFCRQPSGRKTGVP